MSKMWYDQGKDWGETDEPWHESESFVSVILDKINILDILDKYEIDYMRSASGNFTHKLRCPFPEHLGGQERTASLCVSEKKNDFHCYGCNANGHVITFMMLYHGIPYYKALEILARFGNITNDDINDELFVPREKIDPKHTVAPYIFKAGVLIREQLDSVKDSKDYAKWCIWANKQFKKLDHYLNILTNEQWKTASKYYDRLEAYFKQKANK